MKLPIVRNENIVVQDLGRELLIYDLSTHKAYALNETLRIVFNACDGATSFDYLTKMYDFTDDLIYLCLDELRKRDLLAEDTDIPYSTLPRRELIKKVGLTTLLALPAITAITAPPAAQAASVCGGGGQFCNGSDFTQGTCCTNLYCYRNSCFFCFTAGRSCGENGVCCSGVCSGTPLSPGVCLPVPS